MFSLDRCSMEASPHLTIMPRRADSPPQDLPEGFVYQPNFLSEAEEQALLERISALPFQQFEFQGYLARRRIVEYGWEYDFGSRKAAETQPLPDYLAPLRQRVALFANMPEADIVESVVTEYPPGAPIGWHRDVPQFEDVIGISLANPCRMRFKPYKKPNDKDDEWRAKIVSITLEPRSIYLIRGPARWQWQHSIPEVERLRYSITFRTLRKNERSRKSA
jgi:alkylated DNA repair dioxygenase AlkB